MPELPWNSGWWARARQVTSPNHGPRPAHMAIDTVVVHSISLPPGVYGGPQVEQLFTNRLDWDAHPYFDRIRGIEVSSHFFIRRNGETVQFVSVLDRAWHAGQSSWRGRGNCNDFSVGIELEGLEGELFESAQYDAIAALCAALCSQHPVAQIVGHEHVAPGRKQDPGSGFDWPRLRRALGWSRHCFPETTNAQSATSAD
ncbi:MAG: 1,6-anhydro-N-acetylmuramyl-L-alanine amidase AmpD [Hydrogenophaga sp.]|uniref:1,6-anhydro-N-acetylmuramyl-L-alanine amidase AmpD n=1 Tax=Hydrogenophaga sp. TaxID=1904254 RepID=UPI001D7FEC2B|nr:1,6-anhydro-N-acetylmuramyl-L-alanine amidase AmpD [Hydrogenophaga sp.]MBX3610676.1 1,6-anhydro-N-acetylmuramyl-L-alanine amidase AmpD [Hydrogenophaga sp.]